MKKRRLDSDYGRGPKKRGRCEHVFLGARVLQTVTSSEGKRMDLCAACSKLWNEVAI